MKNNLSTFKILFIVKGVLNLAVALFFILYMFLGVFFVNNDAIANDPSLEFNPGILLIIIGGIGTLLAIIFGILTILAGRYLTEHKNYTFILVIAILNCLSGILGILLGVFTIIELSKPEVKVLFGRE